mmetsp:Transcript_31872/g.74515  ORF Transcript_31872/g.74515 Transcript_31872/m.74515 type:complete len:504 (-) Transcript_31872:153-1664(-)
MQLVVKNTFLDVVHDLSNETDSLYRTSSEPGWFDPSRKVTGAWSKGEATQISESEIEPLTKIEDASLKSPDDPTTHCDSAERSSDKLETIPEAPAPLIAPMSSPNTQLACSPVGIDAAVLPLPVPVPMDMHPSEVVHGAPTACSDIGGSCPTPWPTPCSSACFVGPGMAGGPTMIPCAPPAMVFGATGTAPATAIATLATPVPATPFAAPQMNGGVVPAPVVAAASGASLATVMVPAGPVMGGAPCSNLGFSTAAPSDVSATAMCTGAPFAKLVPLLAQATTLPNATAGGGGIFVIAPAVAADAVKCPSSSQQDHAYAPMPHGPAFGCMHQIHPEARKSGELSEDNRFFKKTAYQGLLTTITETQVRTGGQHRYVAQFCGGCLSSADGVGFIFSPCLPCPKNIQQITSVFVNRAGCICFRSNSQVTRSQVKVKQLEIGEWIEVTVDLSAQMATFTVWPVKEDAGPVSASFSFGKEQVKTSADLRVGYFACVVKHHGVSIQIAS